MLSLTPKAKPVIGNCDVCDVTPANTEVFKTQHGLSLCAVHYAAEQAAYNSSKPVIEAAQAIDAAIEVKSDVFTARTIALMELFTSVQQDESIPDDKKNSVLAEVVAKRRDALKTAIFEQRKELRESEQDFAVLESNLQSIIGKLKDEERAKYKEYEPNYKPEPVKRIKDAVGKTPKIKAQGQNSTPQADARAARDAAAKYPGLQGSTVQATAYARHISFEAAAEFLNARFNS